MRSPLVITRRRDGIAAWHPAFLAATWFGCGLLPKAPGTWGSAAALPFAWVLYRLGGSWALLAASGLCFLAGWWASAIYVRRTAVADPSEVVIDEVAGQWLVLAAVPADPLLYVAGFLIFRVLDIWKPWPASWADRHVEGGLGVMLDDMLAAAYGALLMALVALWWSLP
ncbi:MAG: phosphatidylglycerophosphatase A [Rhodospirillaceae bacterium]|nr:phosphatidylglycerophosphatase A [Rhodospirillales bacterium]